MILSWKRLEHLSMYPLMVIFMITSLGILMLFSAANASFSPWATKQAMRFLVGLSVMLVVSATDTRQWFGKAYMLYFATLILLVGVEILGFVGMGAQRWIDLYVFSLQPSELMRVFLILALARYFHGCTLEDIRNLKTLVPPAILIFLPTLFVLRQPDLGTATLLVLSGLSVCFVAGVSIWVFVVLGGSVLALVPILWTFLHPYQQKRVLTFLNPESDPLNSGYHVLQSKIALGSGGVLGKGFLQGTQSHLNFLPEKQTDFIFTMFCEEFGMAGAIFLLVLYGTLIAYNGTVALSCRSQFSRLMATGLNMTLFLYVFINVAMVMGLLPVVGIPLPLFSYGGTAMITILFSQGLIFSVMTHNDVRIGR
jgi:rod shape determining protein RodA